MKITKILIANRGEIACRILRTLKRMSIPGVVVCHAMDADSPVVRMADHAIEIDGPTPVAAYLDMESIIKACKRSGADAVHPGFGFLAENPDFARRLREEGITFIGPSPETIALMGNKVAARCFCLNHGFPLTPSVSEEGGDFLRCARDMGFPLLIKAAAGGGGKAMHRVQEPADLDQAIRQAKGEALRSFGDDRVYAERFVEDARHIEVQVFGDHQGNVVHLGERDCSIQRRFQKIMEESPAPNLPKDLRERICAVAVEIAQKAGYQNAGTVEFLLAPDGEFYFLEMNTRIQVEHPVTERVTGLDLVELQIRVARGEPIPFGQHEVKKEGHAIEVRIYAEDPENDFIPATGSLLRYRLPSGHGVRVDNGLSEGMEINSAFDPMLAKIIVHGKDRQEAIHRAIEALSQTVVLGVTTNVDYLARILSHPAYVRGEIHTGFIPLHGDDLKAPPLTETERNLLLAAVALRSREFIDPSLQVPEPYASIGYWRN